MVALVKFASIFLLGLVSGVSFSHLLQRGPKKTLPAAHFLAVQQVLLRNYGPAIGGLEVVQQDCQFADTRIAPLELGRLPRPMALSSYDSTSALCGRLQRGYLGTVGAMEQTTGSG